MSLLYDPDALVSIPHNDIDRVMKKIDWLWLNREFVTHESLSENLSEFYKRRLGKYRIIYTYDNDSDDMVIRLAGLRDTIYKEADKRLR
jgi:mRNA interferase RelE/StbE